MTTHTPGPWAAASMERKMKVLNKIPTRLPSHPALIRECAGNYAIWTGRSWFGSVNRTCGRSWQPVAWTITTPASPVEVVTTFDAAKAEAESIARRAEGGRA